MSWHARVALPPADAATGRLAVAPGRRGRRRRRRDVVPPAPARRGRRVAPRACPPSAAGSRPGASSSRDVTTIVVDPGAMPSAPGVRHSCIIRPRGDSRRARTRDRVGEPSSRSMDGVRPGGPHQPLRRRSSRKMTNTLLPHRPLGRPQHARATSPAASLTAECTSSLAAAESLPIHVIRGPDLMARAMREYHPELAPRRRLPAQLALSRQLARGRPLDPRAGDRRRRARTASPSSPRRIRPTAATRSPTTYMGRAPRRLRGGRADLPGRPGPAGLRGHARTSCACARCASGCPEQWWGDYLALLGAARIGERELAGARRRARLGHARRPIAAQWFDYCEQRDDRGHRELPGGPGDAARSPPRPASPACPDGIPIKVTVAVEPEDGVDRRRPDATTPTACRAAST